MVRRAALLCLLALLAAPPASADDPTAAMPPEIAAIVAKLKAGGRPTADDLAKLKAWQRGVVDRANAPAVPGGAAQPDGIPCRIRVTLDYAIAAGSEKSSGHVEGTTDATLYAKLGGNGDYYKNALNPDAPASSFRFMPIIPPGATARPAIGGGTARSEAVDPASSRRVTGTLSHVAFAAMLTTTGRGDALWAAGTGLQAQLDGTRSTTDPSGTRASPVHGDDGFTEVTSDLAAPFVDEQRRPVPAGGPTPAPAINLSFSALAAAVRSGKPATVTGTESFAYDANGSRVTGKASITIVLRPRPLELVVEPADEAAFAAWSPLPDDREPGARPDLFGRPKPLAVHVALHDPSKGAARSPGPTRPSADAGGRIDVRLRDVSAYPGMAMDVPKQSEANPSPTCSSRGRSRRGSCGTTRRTCIRRARTRSRRPCWSRRATRRRRARSRRRSTRSAWRRSTRARARPR